MISELETIKTIHIEDDGFRWSYDVKENPDAPSVSIVIKHNEGGKNMGEISMPRCAIKHLIEALNSFSDID